VDTPQRVWLTASLIGLIALAACKPNPNWSALRPTEPRLVSTPTTDEALARDATRQR
jgi:hypothetical protein